jgi:hypothetical protein
MILSIIFTQYIDSNSTFLNINQIIIRELWKEYKLSVENEVLFAGNTMYNLFKKNDII